LKIIILGGGSIGGSVAKELSSEENDVVVIDNNDENLEPIKGIEGIQAIHGNGSSPNTLAKAGLDEESLLLCLTDSEEINLLASLIGKQKFNAGRIVCRLKGSEYTKIAKEITPFVDFFINPEDLITDEIKSLLHHPGALEILDFAEGKIKLVSVYAKPSGILVGRQIKELKDDLPEYETRIPAIYRGDELIIPTGTTTINEGDEVYFIADEKHIEDVTKELQQLESQYKNIFVAGAGNIGKSLVKKINDDFNTKLIDKNKDKCELASEELDDVLILNSDAADKEFLSSEGISECDVFVAVTQDDESNVLCSLMSKKLGSKKSITIINKEAYFDLVGKNELDIIISPVQITVSHVLKFIRKGSVSNVHKVKKGMAEAIEIGVDASSEKLKDKLISELGLDENINIPAIKRGEEVIMAHGNTQIHEDDHLIVFYKNKDVIDSFYEKFR
jgi:trk system potassium uptake protein TrkA